MTDKVLGGLVPGRLVLPDTRHETPDNASTSFVILVSFVILASPFVIGASSFSCHSQLHKEKRVNVGQLLNALVQSRANAMSAVLRFDR